MNARILKFHLMFFSHIFLFSFSLSAQIEFGDTPAFHIDERPWYLLEDDSNTHENIRLYAHHDSEASKTSAPEQALLLHVSYINQEGLSHFQEEIQKIYPDAILKKIRDENDFKIYEALAPNKDIENPLPEMMFITAVFEKDKQYVTILYALTIKCKNCLRLAEKWVARFENAQANSDETALILEEKYKIPLHLFNSEAASFYRTSAADGFYPWISDFFKAAYALMTVGGTTLLFYGGKFVMGVMGVAPPCKKTGGQVCCCAPGM